MEHNKIQITVAADGSGQFTSLQEAVDSLPDDSTSRVNIYVKKGTYREKVFIDRPFVTLIGEKADETILEYGDYAKMKTPEGEEIRTFCTYTFFTGGHDFRAENLTFANTAGKGEVVGQAVAAYVDGDRSMFINCRFIGNQDTLFTGPLPPYPLTVKTFGSPRDGLPATMSRQYYKDCYIQGDIDFIFGSATAVFEDCEIFSNRLENGENSFITAPSSPEGEKYGYVFINCRLTGDAAPGSVYLGRPWRNFGKVAFINCRMGLHIKEEGWHNWDKPESESTTFFAEYGSTGSGSVCVIDMKISREHEQASTEHEKASAEHEHASSKHGHSAIACDIESEQRTFDRRVHWAKQLTWDEAEQYTAAKVLCGKDGWKPGK